MVVVVVALSKGAGVVVFDVIVEATAVVVVVRDLTVVVGATAVVVALLEPLKGTEYG